MRPRVRLLSRLSARATAATFVSILLLVSAAPISQAQSGRRPPKQPSSPDPLPSKSEEPPIQPSSERNSTPKIPVKVVWQMSFNASNTYSQAVQEACLTRLGQSGSIQPTASSKEVNRKEAIDIAKASADTYVVWFELEADSSYNGGGGMGSVPPQYLTVRFEMYTPTTGKTKTSGHIYQRPQGPGGLPIPGSGTYGSGLYSLGYAGREMADRVLDTLGVTHPPH
jgi:hypothetical protein